MPECTQLQNTKPLLRQVISQQLKFIGHIPRLPDGELAKHMPSMCQRMEDDVMAASIPASCLTYNTY